MKKLLIFLFCLLPLSAMGASDAVLDMAVDIGIEDTGNFYTGDEVESALQEIGNGTTLDGRYVNLDGESIDITNGTFDLTTSGIGTFTTSIKTGDATIFENANTDLQFLTDSGWIQAEKIRTWRAGGSEINIGQSGDSTFADLVFLHGDEFGEIGDIDTSGYRFRHDPDGSALFSLQRQISDGLAVTLWKWDNSNNLTINFPVEIATGSPQLTLTDDENATLVLNDTGQVSPWILEAQDDFFCISFGASRYLKINDAGNVDFQLGDLTTLGNITGDLITGTTISGGFSAGSVLFSNGSILSQDNPNFFWNDSTNRLHLGGNSPDALLHLSAISGNAKIILQRTNAISSGGQHFGSLEFRNSAGDMLGELGFDSADASGVESRFFFSTSQVTDAFTIGKDGFMGLSDLGSNFADSALHINYNNPLVTIQSLQNDAIGGKIRFVETNATFQGGYIHYAGGGTFNNQFIIGGHNTTDKNLANDKPMLLFNRDGADIIVYSGVDLNFRDEATYITSDADTFMDVYADGALRIHTDTLWVGAGTGHFYGNMDQATGTFDVTLTTAGDWVELDAATTNIVAGPLNDITFNGDHFLKVNTAGVYTIAYSLVSMINSIGGSEEHIEFQILKNGNITGKGETHVTFKNVLRELPGGSITMLVLAVDDEISVGARNTSTSGKVITIDHLEMNVVMVGG